MFKFLKRGDSKTAGKTQHVTEESTREDIQKVPEEKAKTKGPGFFEKWQQSTSDAYDKHRAGGGNL